MRVLVVSDYFYPDIIGGAEKVTMLMVDALIERGFIVDVLTTNTNQDKFYQYKSANVSSFKSNYKRWMRSYLSIFNPFILSKSYKCLRNKKYDKVFVHNIHYRLSFSILPLLKVHSDNVVLTLHDAMPLVFGKAKFNLEHRMSIRELYSAHGLRHNPFYRPLAKYFLSGVKLVAVSNRLKELYLLYGYKDISVINNAIPLKKNFSLEENGNVSSLENQKITFFLPGRINRLKGKELALRAFKALHSKYKNVELVITDKGNSNTDGVKNIGWVSPEEIEKFYRNSDVVLCPSIYLEPFGLVVLEAASYGKNVIISDSIGSIDFVINGKSGIIFRSGCVYSLYSAMKMCVTQPGINQDFGEVNKINFISQSFDNYIDNYLDV